MKINIIKDGKNITLAVEGKVDTSTAKQLGDAVKGVYDEAETLTFDFKDLDYISSAGLRVILSAYKVMIKKGGMKVINVNEMVMEVFEATGFADSMDIS